MGPNNSTNKTDQPAPDTNADDFVIPDLETSQTAKTRKRNRNKRNRQLRAGLLAKVGQMAQCSDQGPRRLYLYTVEAGVEQDSKPLVFATAETDPQRAREQMTKFAVDILYRDETQRLTQMTETDATGMSNRKKKQAAAGKKKAEEMRPALEKLMRQARKELLAVSKAYPLSLYTQEETFYLGQLETTPEEIRTVTS